MWTNNTLKLDRLSLQAKDQVFKRLGDSAQAWCGNLGIFTYVKNYFSSSVKSLIFSISVALPNSSWLRRRSNLQLHMWYRNSAHYLTVKPTWICLGLFVFPPTVETLLSFHSTLSIFLQVLSPLSWMWMEEISAKESLWQLSSTFFNLCIDLIVCILVHSDDTECTSVFCADPNWWRNCCSVFLNLKKLGFK